ncbi:hypothetical protein Tco_1028491 [Tanacetum coccineum]|uniref:Biogenesis of lysosome-related organelles complex 1 subunit 7 n=1 Tax=Tanacetum coccineum TaxID=301880 RepID=A0ABQ5G132_9ASTR
MIDADAIADLPLSDSELSEMPDDNLQSLSDIGLIESSKNDDDTHSVHHSEDTIHASAELNTDLQSLHEHMNHICKEVSLLHSNMADLESNLITKVSDDIKSTMPTLINNALTNVLRSEIDQSFTNNILDVMEEVKTDLQTQRKHLHMLSKDVQRLQYQMLEISNLLHSVYYDDETTEGGKTKKESKNLDTTQGEQHAKPENEERAMILHTSEEKKNEAEIVNVANSTDSDDFDTHPLFKKFKISPSIPDIINPTPLISPSIIDIIKPTPLSLILPELPIRDKSKGKEVAKDDSMLEITSLLKKEDLLRRL